MTIVINTLDFLKSALSTAKEALDSNYRHVGDTPYQEYHPKYCNTVNGFTGLVVDGDVNLDDLKIYTNLLTAAKDLADYKAELDKGK